MIPLSIPEISPWVVFVTRRRGGIGYSCRWIGWYLCLAAVTVIFFLLFWSLVQLTFHLQMFLLLWPSEMHCLAKVKGQHWVWDQVGDARWSAWLPKRVVLHLRLLVARLPASFKLFSKLLNHTRGLPPVPLGFSSSLAPNATSCRCESSLARSRPWVTKLDLHCAQPFKPWAESNWPSCKRWPARRAWFWGLGRHQVTCWGILDEGRMLLFELTEWPIPILYRW